MRICRRYAFEKTVFAKFSHRVGQDNMLGRIKTFLFRLIESYSKWYDRLCGIPPHLRPWHFQWHAQAPLDSDLREVLSTLRGSVLDVGCGSQPYRQYLIVDSYVGLDISPSPNVDVTAAPGDPFPFESESFDAILCTQVIEHVEDLPSFLAETDRVLAHNGTLILSAPFIYPVHGAPHDYRRFSEHGLRSIMPGYTILTTRRQGGIGSTLALLLLCWMHNQLGTTTLGQLLRFLGLPLFLPLSLFCNFAGWALDQIDTTDTTYGNLLIVAQKTTPPTCG
ncbi:class I SAM-dependent methyltransferase [Paucidesulfovibrio longus]|uniref:class I SAM-dependent methyltransferase n=1 Tax=Paucidesulfovibrio longus TaxID=889 RepID=UPI0003B777AB|nr:class I SAM-dependent methyltransferase [Paucidesulfovibrio longus]